MPEERPCVLPGSFVSDIFHGILNLDYKDTRFALWDCQKPGIEDSVAIDLRPSRWEYHPSSISVTCIKRPYGERECMVEADIVSTSKSVESIEKRVDEIHTGYEHGIKEYACKVVAVHEHGGEYHNHVSCYPVDIRKVTDVVIELAKISSEAEKALW